MIMNVFSFDDMPFGELLRELRVEKGIGLSRFAKLVGLQTSALAAIEHGRAHPLPELRERFADSLMLSPEERHQLMRAECGPPDKRSFHFS